MSERSFVTAVSFNMSICVCLKRLRPSTAPGMDKLTRLNFGESAMTHAMVFTAYGVLPPPRDPESTCQA